MTQPRLVGNRYELGELIGYGGMAEVHRGRDVRLGREVAIKILRADLARDPSFLNRFRREAQSAAGLNHPAIVAVYDTGEDEGPGGAPVPFIVMEYVEGRTLRDIIKSEGPLPPRRATEIAAEVAGALDFSHRNGLIHRDVKPANVMITGTGAVKVMDFGIARALSDNAATVTQTAAVIGTAQYLSPEQARGESVDARSDVYSTGCLLYELLTGQPPFQGDSPVAVAYQHVRENAPPPSSINSQVPRSLDSIVMKALAKNPLNRYQSAAEMREDLQRVLADRPVQAEAVLTDDERTQYIARSNAVPALPRPVVPVGEDYDDGHGRGKWIWVAVVVALLLVIGVAAYAIVKAGGNKTAMVQVPSIVGQTQTAAETALRNARLTPGTPTVANGNCSVPTPAVGTVCTQALPAGTSLSENSTVNFTIYQVGTTQVPQCQGQTYQACTQQMQDAKLQYSETQVDNSAAAGTVLSTSPAAYTQVQQGSSVVITVSSGEVAVASQVGKSQQDATTGLNGLGFLNVVAVPQTTNDPTKNGIVIGQSPNGGSFGLSTKITLNVGQYAAPSPTCTTPAPTPTPTTSGPPTPGVTPTPSVSTTPTPTPGQLPAC
jgi:beta-lactam-binding protein with PASTA domain